jgi:D-glycero-D-manno-heptose 1,7-bisphosphate phosphatase
VNSKPNRAVFLDRDGVINPLVFNRNTGEYESPHYPEDFSIYSYVLKSLLILKKMDFITIIVSNQPSYAKGKTSLENIKNIEKLLYDFSEENGRLIDAYYYCYHHPDGIIPGYAVKCRCRKPGTFFLEEAIMKYSLDINRCYFIGDQDSDIKCGNSMKIHTIKIWNKHSSKKSGFEKPLATVNNLLEAVGYIEKGENHELCPIH